MDRVKQKLGMPEKEFEKVCVISCVLVYIVNKLVQD